MESVTHTSHYSLMQDIFMSETTVTVSMKHKVLFHNLTFFENGILSDNFNVLTLQCHISYFLPMFSAF